jgi:hypothetical protein
MSCRFEFIRRLLSNLWSRGAILQCSHNQSSIDLLCAVYFGSLVPGALFDVNKLGGVVLQIKNTFKAATPEEGSIPPIGIPRDLDLPLPYLTCVLELGNESVYQETKTKIKTTASAPPTHGQLRKLMDDLTLAMDELDQYLGTESPTKTKIDQLKKIIEAKRLAMEDYNRYSISVRGATPETYGILKEADIVMEFATLLDITMPPLTEEALELQHMQPLRQVDESSPSTAWMWEGIA